MRYLSVCSGIEAATVAWHPLGWTPVAFSEIEAFPSAVLAHHYPNVPNYGDMTQHEQWPITRGAIDLLVGGTPCQSFSVAGLRKGLRDPRGGLMLTYLEIAQRLRPRWVVWENVPGVLSSGGGRDFGSFLGALGELGYGWAYRVLDAQWCRTHRHPRAVPQRRRRVFVVGCLGDGAAAAAVLFESQSVRRDPASRRATGQGVAADAEAGAGGGGCYWNGEQIASALTRKGCDDRMPDKERLFAVLQPVAYRWQNDRDGLQEDDAVAALRASARSSGFHEMNHPVVAHAAVFRKSKRAQSDTDDETWVPADQANTLNAFDTGERDTHAVAIGTDCYNGAITGDVAATMGTPGSSVNASGPTVMHAAVAVSDSLVAKNNQCTGIPTEVVAHAVAPSLTATNDPSRSPQSAEVTQQVAAVHAATMTVRRLTPRECERLQGFPDDYTAIPWRGKADAPDGPRYKALGNSMAVNCMAWIGERINSQGLAQ